MSVRTRKTPQYLERQITDREFETRKMPSVVIRIV